MDDYRNGLQVKKSCTINATVTKQISGAFPHAYELAQAGLEAANDTGSPELFDTFFKPEERQIVVRSFKNIVKALTVKVKFPIAFFCNDPAKLCPIGTPAYHVDLYPYSNLAPIHICPDVYLQLPEQVNACDIASLNLAGKTDQNSHGHVIVHEMMHISFMSGKKRRTIDDCAFGGYAAHVMRTKTDKFGDLPGSLKPNCKQRDPSQNVDNFAMLAVWAWIRKEQQQLCPEHYPLWGMLEKIKEEKPSNDHSELRHLLSLGEGGGNTTLSDQQIRDAFNGTGMVDYVTLDSLGDGQVSEVEGP